MTIFAIVFAVCCSSIAMKVGDPPGLQMQAFAKSLIASLDEEQSGAALLPFDSINRVDWHFIPKKDRKGLMLGQMNDAQAVATFRLLRAALSEAGYDKANNVMMLENTLRALEAKNGKWERNPNKYYLTFFGEPSDKGSWGLSFEGHHLSLNFVCRDGRMVDSTPQFFAANPAMIMDDLTTSETSKESKESKKLGRSTDVLLGKGTRVLRDEEEFGFALLNSLDDEQQQQAVIAPDAPRDIRFAGQPQADVGEPEGIAYADLDAQQRQMLENLVEVYVGAVADPIADQRRQLIEDNGWQHVHFAWAGASEPGIGHYYRIQGKSFLIEFVNTQPDAAGNPANHIHAVLRDLTGDFDLTP
ncbi:DUF3500 domain-containing protein [Rubripirellula obstinata]|nr:DUF3500 domain-containing protein [Rubripirellula obstinata]